MCIYLPTDTTPSGCCFNHKNIKILHSWHFSSFELDLMFVEDVAPASVVLVGVAPPHPLMLPSAGQPSPHQTIVSSVQIKFNERL